ncbi:MAG: 4Fe-4S dicluster domain-containing protein [Treponema sp.]|jgi:Fe-S-cluster-containing hydrogenase component 2|nr:4Fe-4S dicluster domain-containing protein [Treponema sp.]
MKNDYHVIIDKEKCVGCALCRKDCPHHALELRDGKAALLSDTCLMCGHCIAICPQAAVTIRGYDMNEVKAYDKTGFGIDSDVLLPSFVLRGFDTLPFRVIKKVLNPRV